MKSFDETTECETADDVVTSIAMAVDEAAQRHTDITWDGIGAYEFQGQRCNDRGNEVVEFNGFVLALDISKFNARELTKLHDAAELESSGTTSFVVDESDKEYSVDWKAKWRCFLTQDGKDFSIYEITQD